MKMPIPSPGSVFNEWVSTIKILELKSFVFGGLLAIGLSLVVIVAFWKNLPPVVPLWYSKAWGEDQLANPFFLFLLPGTALAWTGISLTFAGNSKETPLFAKLLVIASCLGSILSLITIVNILIVAI